jgi:hypothetical protein
MLLNVSPVLGIENIRDSIVRYPANDIVLLSASNKTALDFAQMMITNRKCTIVMTSSGTWYYLLKTPACLNFHQPLYGAEVSAQEQMVVEAEIQKPDWIVMDVPPDDVTELPHKILLPILYDWAYKHYEPWFEKNGLVVWKRKVD